MANANDIEKSIISSLNMMVATQGRILTNEELYILAKQVASLFNYDGPLDGIVIEAEMTMTTFMGLGVTLYDENANHDKDWVFKRDKKIKWQYSDAYETHLKQEKWPPKVVDGISEVGKVILGYLQDPESEGAWDRRGLVIGNVQSGKTANYVGLIGKAADAGYGLIIVIAGIQNSLRKQTQERIDSGFLGRSSDPNESRSAIGVGKLAKNYPFPVSLTTINTDFNKHMAKSVSTKIDDFKKPVVLVIKKNVHTLDALYAWLKDLNAEKHGRIANVPMLMIDDEADHASINTAKPENDPTRTNSMIRKILGLFDKSSFVGYTATPFANIFINPEAYEEDVMDELFPRDFIYCLDASSSYFGPEKVFGETNKSPVIEIDDAENYIPFSHKIYDEIVALPPTMIDAIHLFILAKTVRNIRGQRNKHCSMMIHVSRFVNIQNQVCNLVADYKREVESAVKANYMMPESIANKNHILAALKNKYEEEYATEDLPWGEVKKELYGAFENFRVYEINGRSGDTLNFSDYEKSGHGLTVIAVGGNSLSRGLTIEGLTVSYFYRNTRMYDTLMQMGRWFGYRPNYEDLCRVFLPKVSQNWYAHIAESTSELREQVAQMQRDRLSPKDFGLYVKDHPDSLLVTASNKMQSGEKLTVSQNYSGKQIESIVLPLSKEINDINTRHIASSFKNRFGANPQDLFETDKGWAINGVDTKELISFLKKFRVHEQFAGRLYIAIKYLEEMQKIYKISDVNFISKSEKYVENSEHFLLGEQLRATGNFDNHEEGYWLARRYRIATGGDEKLGLTEKQVILAKANHKERSTTQNISDYYYREVRDRPLLMLHNLKLQPKKDDEFKTTIKNVPAFSISFPPGHYSKSVKVVANSVWIELMHGNLPNVDGYEGDDDE